ncbi:hypothetical protein ACVIGA_000172 [Bradyrhizobium sp. USDA 3240]
MTIHPAHKPKMTKAAFSHCPMGTNMPPFFVPAHLPQWVIRQANKKPRAEARGFRCRLD